MRMSFQVPALVSISLLFTAFVSPHGSAAAASQPCSITISDASGYKITSDRLGSYIDGSQGVSCQVGGSTNNVKLTLTSPKVKGIPRAFWGDYTDQATTGGPTGTFTDGSYIMVQEIASMPPGSAATAHIHFRFHNTPSGFWFFNWCGGTCLNYPGMSEAVWVSRTTATHWDVSTQPPLNTTTAEPVGDLAELQDGDTNSYSYHLPFHLTIDCSTCK